MAAMESSSTLAYPETATQWIFTGVSNDPDARTAGVTAAMRALAGDGSRRGGDEVRFVAGDLNMGSLSCIAAVPQGSMVRIMRGDYDSVLGATNVACEQAVAALGGRTPLGLLAFDCIARKGVLGDEGITAEVGRITDYAPVAPVAGFYTYGEIARTRGVSGFHNQTLVVVAFS
jgi:small ligand-binding sensory domain FIST